MAIIVQLTWPGVTQELYDQLREVVGWERDHADGGVFHAVGFDGDGARIFDVWESAEHFQRFVDERLTPAVQQVGIPGEPGVQVFEAHAVFAPAYG